MKLPNANRAFVDITKLRDYSLDVVHKEGKHKLGFLRQQLA